MKVSFENLKQFRFLKELLPSGFFSEFAADSFRKYFCNTLWLFLERVVRLGIALISSILIARHLGPGEFGLLQYATSFVGLFGLITTLGLDTIVTRELVKYPETRNALLGTACTLKGATAIGVVGILWVTVTLQGYAGDLAFMVLVIGAALVPQMLNVIELFFQAEVQARVGALVYMAAVTAGAVWTLAGVMMAAPVRFFAFQGLLESGFVAFGLWLGYRFLQGRIIEWSFDRRLALKLLRESWPLAFSMAMVSIYANTDKIMVRTLLGDEATGLYAAAVKLSEAWYFVPTVIVNSLFPAIVRAREVSLEHYHRRLQALYDLMVWLAVAIAIPISLLADKLMVFLYGEPYRAAGMALCVHVWTGVLVFLGVASGRWFILEGMSQSYFLRTLAGVVCNILFAWLLIPIFGILGAALATLLAQVGVVFVFDAVGSRTRISFVMKCRALFPLQRLRKI